MPPCKVFISFGYGGSEKMEVEFGRGKGKTEVVLREISQLVANRGGDLVNDNALVEVNLEPRQRDEQVESSF